MPPMKALSISEKRFGCVGVFDASPYIDHIIVVLKEDDVSRGKTYLSPAVTVVVIEHVLRNDGKQASPSEAILSPQLIESLYGSRLRLLVSGDRYAAVPRGGPERD